MVTVNACCSTRSEDLLAVGIEDVVAVAIRDVGGEPPAQQLQLQAGDFLLIEGGKVRVGALVGKKAFLGGFELGEKSRFARLETGCIGHRTGRDVVADPDGDGNCRARLGIVLGRPCCGAVRSSHRDPVGKILLDQVECGAAGAGPM